MRATQLFCFFTAMVPVMGCLPSAPSAFDLFGDLSGHYEGALTNHLDGKTYSQTAVNADIAAHEKFPVTVAIKDERGTPRLTFTVSNVTRKSITFLSSIGMTTAIKLAVDPITECFVGVGVQKIILCAEGPEVSFEIQNPKDGTSQLSLVMHHFNKSDSAPPQEISQSFSLTKAISQARTKSFTSRIEFEHLVQAKARAKAAYLHLLPQITLGTIANNLTPSFSSILGAIGDLAPFLLPGRWIEADQAVQQSKAEQDASLLMRLDMGVQVEGLFYAYARDSKTRDLTHDIFTRATAIRDEVKVREDLGQLPLGSTANLDSILNQIQQNLTVLDQVKAEDLASISQTLGFFSPTAVGDAVIDAELVPIDNAPPVDFKVINAAALDRAIELDQMDDLIVAATDAKKASYFSWLDPYGDPSLGLGFALPSQVTVLKSQKNELKTARGQLEQIVSQKAFSATVDYEQALASYKTANEGMSIQQNRLDTMMSNLNAGVKVDFFGLIGILQDYLSGEISIEAARANYRVARAEIDRLLLQGYYAKF